MLEFMVFGVNQGLICCHAHSGEKVSMCHFKEIDFWQKNIFGGIGGPKMDPK